jgi:serine/threonine-protein kinase
MIGSQLGNYRVTSRLGEGGMGTVYRAVDTMLDRDVALKVLRPELARQAALVERFRAEAVALARLRHEHIAALYGLDRQADEFVMVMEYVSGDTLEARLARDGAMSWQDAVPVMRGVLAALGHAHVRGVVHRDIKPANVMIDAEGTVKVMDFGIARLMGENRQTRAGVAIGTPSYMAPEQLRGEDVDGRTDIYAAGALLFELLTGRVAFQADSDYSLMMQQLNEPPVPPSTFTHGVPRALDAVVARAMAKKPAQRFATATDFANALDGVTPDAFTVEPIREAAAAVVARAPRDWRVYVIAASMVLAVGLGAAALRARAGTGAGGTSTTGGTSTQSDDSSATRKGAGPGPDPVRPTGGTVATVIGSGMHEQVNEPSPSPSSTPTPRPTPVATTTPSPARPQKVVPKALPTPAPVQTRPVATTQTAPDPTPTPAKASDSEGSIRNRVQSLASRCVEAISDNQASAAARLLRGESGEMMAIVRDHRVQSGSHSSVDVDLGDGGGRGTFTADFAWVTPFGGKKASRVAMVAHVTDAGENYCQVVRWITK